MTSRINLRRPNIKAAAQLATIKSTDKLGRARAIEVPGHHAYRLVLLARNQGAIVAECLMQTAIGLVPCKGNGQHTVCYHALGAVQAASGGRVRGWFATKRDAKRALNLRQFGGHIVGKVLPKVSGRIVNKSVWFLWRA